MMRLRVSLTVVCLGLLAQVSFAQPGKVERDLYAVLVFDTDADRGRPDGIGPSVETDRENLTTLLRNAYRDHPMPGRLYLKVFDGASARERVVRDYLSDLRGKVKPTDTVLFYYSGHGGESKYDNQRFWFSHDKRWGPFRFYFEEEIERLHPNLKIILYDCCANRASPRPLVAFGARNRPRAASGQVNPRLFQQLFFEGKNWVIIAATKTGDVSWGNPSIGGIFTYTVLDSLSRDLEAFDADKNGRVTWQEFYNTVKERTNRLDSRQTPEAHYLCECRNSEYHVKLVNGTDELIAVRFRYLRNFELEQLDPAKLTKAWLQFVVPPRGELLASDGTEPLRVYSYQLTAVGQQSHKQYNHSTNPTLANQHQAGTVAINLGIPYNAGPDGTRTRTVVHAFGPRDTR